MQTVVKEQYDSETLVLHNNLFETDYKFVICGQDVERSCEDRSVYFDFTEGGRGWLTGEQAIEFGQALIKHGTRALIANMVNHQLSNRMTRFKEFLQAGIVSKVVITKIDDHPANHGPGFATYTIKPQWVEGMAPQYEEDFEFEKVIYWSPFEDEYTKQLAYYGGQLVEFVGYDHEADVGRFKRACEEMQGPVDSITVTLELSKEATNE